MNKLEQWFSRRGHNDEIGESAIADQSKSTTSVWVGLLRGSIERVPSIHCKIMETVCTRFFIL